MKEAGIHAVAKEKYKATTVFKHSLSVVVNHLNRKLSVNKLNQFRVADITYIYTQEGWTSCCRYERKILSFYWWCLYGDCRFPGISFLLW